MNFLRNILDVVETAFKVDLRDKRRTRELVDARRVYCYIARKLTNKGYQDIGRLIGKNHATMIHYMRDFDTLLKHDRQLKASTIYCLEKSKTMMNIETRAPKEILDENWEDLSLKQQEDISNIVFSMVQDNNRAIISPYFHE